MQIKNNEKINYWKTSGFLENFFQKILLNNRKKIFKIFQKNITLKKNDLIIDIGTSPLLLKSENYFLTQFNKNKNLTCFSNQNLSPLKKKFKFFKFIKGDARNLKIKNNSFDIVHSNATIEHVGYDNDQIKFIKGCYGISKKYVFITTPNKYYPIDFHTKIPLLHILPHKYYNFLMKIFGDNFFRKKKNLNLLTTKKIVLFLKKLNITNYKIVYNKFLFIKSNIIIIINKKK